MPYARTVAEYWERTRADLGRESADDEEMARRRKALTPAEKQAAYRARLHKLGIRTVTVAVPAECIDELRELAEALCADRDLRPTRAASLRTGRVVSVAQVLKRHRPASVAG